MKLNKLSTTKAGVFAPPGDAAARSKQQYGMSARKPLIQRVWCQSQVVLIHLSQPRQDQDRARHSARETSRCRLSSATWRCSVRPRASGWVSASDLQPTGWRCRRQAALHSQGAPGPSGVDAAGWRRMCYSFGTESISLFHAIAALAGRLCCSNIDPSILEGLVTCRLIPLNKDPGVRPIGAGEMLCRRGLVAKSVLSVVCGDITQVCGAMAFGTVCRTVCWGGSAGCRSRNFWLFPTGGLDLAHWLELAHWLYPAHQVGLCLRIGLTSHIGLTWWLDLTHSLGLS